MSKHYDILETRTPAEREKALMQALPQGAKMLATGVITPFMVPVKVTALVAFMSGRCAPRFAPRVEFGVRHQQFEFAVRHVELDAVAGFDETQRTADGRLGRDVQHYGAERSSAHARIRNTHHVFDTGAREFLRNG